MSLEAAVAGFLNSSILKALIGVFAFAAAASPVVRFFHDRHEEKFRAREVAALERLAAAAEKKNEQV